MPFVMSQGVDLQNCLSVLAHIFRKSELAKEVNGELFLISGKFRQDRRTQLSENIGEVNF